MKSALTSGENQTEPHGVPIAAEYGCDGKTHAEVIEDWREAFDAWISDKHKWQRPERFMAAVNAHFDAVEAWHDKNGSLFEPIG